jgi:hypothetical protein
MKKILISIAMILCLCLIAQAKVKDLTWDPVKDYCSDCVAVHVYQKVGSIYTPFTPVGYQNNIVPATISLVQVDVQPGQYLAITIDNGWESDYSDPAFAGDKPPKPTGLKFPIVVIAAAAGGIAFLAVWLIKKIF